MCSLPSPPPPTNPLGQWPKRSLFRSLAVSYQISDEWLSQSQFKRIHCHVRLRVARETRTRKESCHTLQYSLHVPRLSTNGTVRYVRTSHYRAPHRISKLDSDWSARARVPNLASSPGLPRPKLRHLVKSRQVSLVPRGFLPSSKVGTSVRPLSFPCLKCRLQILVLAVPGRSFLPMLATHLLSSVLFDNGSRKKAKLFSLSDLL